MVFLYEHGNSLHVNKPCRAAATYVTWNYVTPSSHVYGWRFSLISFLLFLMVFLKGCLCSIGKCPRVDLPNYLYSKHTALNPSENSTCLILSDKLSAKVCKTKDPAKREKAMRDLNLTFCGFKLYSVIPSKEEWRKVGCSESLNRIQRKDEMVGQIFSDFTDVMKRYDCDYSFSRVGNCEECEIAYKRWLCSLYIPYYEELVDGKKQQILPCLKFCEDVSRSCPFFRPDVAETQGEQGFICKDKKIRQDFDNIYGEQGSDACCYEPCHVYECDGGQPLKKLNCTVDNSNSCTNCMHSGGRSTLHSDFYKIICVYIVVVWIQRTFLPYMSIGLT